MYFYPDLEKTPVFRLISYKKLQFLGLFYKKQIPKAVNTSNNHSFLPLTTTNFNLMPDFMKTATFVINGDYL